MAKKQPRTRTKRQTTIPPALSGLLALLHDSANSDDADEMARALAAARLALRDPLRGEGFESNDRAWRFIVSEAERGSWKQLHAAIVKLEVPEDSDLNAITGDFQNVYGGPALAMGIALAYVFLREGGVR
jgi:hypothetical protein